VRFLRCESEVIDLFGRQSNGHRDRTVSPLRRFVRRHRFSTFVTLTFVLTWLPWLTVAWLLQTGRPPVVTTLILIGGFGPFLAAVLVAAAGGDLRSWLRNLVDTGALLRVWAAAVLVPVALYVLALGVFLLAGGGFDRASVLPAAAVPAVVFATFIRGGLEEPGWRGMALPVLQRSIGAFQASVVIGVIWALWHVPLFLMPGSSQAGTPFWLYAPAVVGLSVVTTWLYNAAGGRVLVPVLFHTLSNAVSVTTATGVVGDGVVSQAGLLVVIWVVVAVLVWRYGTDRLASKPLPDGGLDLVTRDGSGRHKTPCDDAVGSDQT
jgi:membrane protease YdiL (CAAX protease family)